MPDITVSVADAQNAALASEATERSTDDATVTAADVAAGVVASHADRLRRDQYISWYKSQGIDGMQKIYNANQG